MWSFRRRPSAFRYLLKLLVHKPRPAWYLELCNMHIELRFRSPLTLFLRRSLSFCLRFRPIHSTLPPRLDDSTGDKAGSCKAFVDPHHPNRRPVSEFQTAMGQRLTEPISARFVETFPQRKSNTLSGDGKTINGMVHGPQSLHTKHYIHHYEPPIPLRVTLWNRPRRSH